MEKNWIDKWLTPISQNKREDLSKLFSVLKDYQEELGRDTFEIPYQEFHNKDIKGNVQNWLRNLWRKGVIEIWYPNKSRETMGFSVDAPYDEYEEENITSGAEIKLNLEKFKAVYLWLETHLVHIKQPSKITNELKKTINQIIKIVKGKKEKKLLQVLSDLKAHKRNELIGKAGYPVSLNALSQMKIKLNKVLNRNGFYISTEPPVGFIDPTGFYHLNSSPILNNEVTFQV